MDAPSALAVASIALLVDALLAGVPGLRGALRAPATAMDAIVGWFDAKLNRPRRDAASLGLRSAIVVLFLAGPAAVVGLALVRLAESVPHGWIIEVAAATSLLAGRRAFDLAHAVGRALRRHGAVAGRAALGREARYDTTQLDEHAIARGVIENCAARSCDGVIAPVFWFLILGLPGMCAYRAVNVAANRIGVPTARHAAFGFVAARLDQVLNALPAPICGLLLAIATAFVPGARPARALRLMTSGPRWLASPAAQWTEAAFAGALDLSLAGPRRYADGVVSGPWIGRGRSRATPGDVARAGFLFAVAYVLTTGALASLALALV